MSEELKAPTNWPNPERPGVPMFPERDGMHLFQDESGEYGSLGIFWSARNHTWYCDENTEAGNEWPDEILKNCRYIGPVLTPTQITEMLAEERERAAKKAQYVSDKYYLERKKEPNGFARENCTQRMLGAAECVKAISNLGDAP